MMAFAPAFQISMQVSLLPNSHRTGKKILRNVVPALHGANLAKDKYTEFPYFSSTKTFSI